MTDGKQFLIAVILMLVASISYVFWLEWIKDNWDSLIIKWAAAVGPLLVIVILLLWV